LLVSVAWEDDYYMSVCATHLVAFIFVF